MRDRVISTDPPQISRLAAGGRAPPRAKPRWAGVLHLQAAAGNRAVSALLTSPRPVTDSTVFLQRQGFGDVRVVEGRDEQREKRRAYTIRFFDKIKDDHLREAYVSRLERYLNEGGEDNKYWDLDTIEEIVTKRLEQLSAKGGPKQDDWHELERQKFEAKLVARERGVIAQERKKRLAALPWYQRYQIEGLEPHIQGWTEDEQSLARDLLWKWIELQNEKRPVKQIKEQVQGLVKACYEQWLRAVDAGRLKWFTTASSFDLRRARGDGDKPGVSWFADANSPGPLRLHDLESYMRVVSRQDDVAPIDAVYMWAREFRTRTNKELLAQAEYLQKVLLVVNLGVILRGPLGTGRVPGSPTPEPSQSGEAPAKTAEPPVAEPTTSTPRPQPASPSPKPAKQVGGPPREDVRRSEGRAGREEQPAEQKRDQPLKTGQQETQQTKLNAKKSGGKGGDKKTGAKGAEGDEETKPRGGHTKNKRPSTRGKHQEGDTTRAKQQEAAQERLKAADAKTVERIRNQALEEVRRAAKALPDWVQKFVRDTQKPPELRLETLKQELLKQNSPTDVDNLIDEAGISDAELQEFLIRNHILE